MAKEKKVGTNYADVLSDNEWDDLARLYEETEAMPDPEPIPAGDYKARLVDGKLIRSNEKGTRGYRLAFEVVEGDYRGRRVWDTSWLTRAAMPAAKRKLAPLGIHSLDQLREPLPENLFCTLKVTVHYVTGRWNSRAFALVVKGNTYEGYCPVPRKGVLFLKSSPARWLW